MRSLYDPYHDTVPNPTQSFPSHSYSPTRYETTTASVIPSLIFIVVVVAGTDAGPSTPSFANSGPAAGSALSLAAPPTPVAADVDGAEVRDESSSGPASFASKQRESEGSKVGD